ncbi:hypothetical protein UlMin_006683 [Ulmus minor]
MERTSSTIVGKPPNPSLFSHLKQNTITSHQQNLIQTTNETTVVDDSTEISIFDAQKYFNELNIIDPQKLTINGGSSTNNNRVSPLRNDVDLSGVSRFSSASSSIDGYSTISRNYQTRSFHSAATPTASSEASWNSQTGLLSIPPGSMAVSVRNPLSSPIVNGEKMIRKSESLSSPPSRWKVFRKKCPCSCKKSVHVREQSIRVERNQQPQPQTSIQSTTNDLFFHSNGLRTSTPNSKSSMAEIRTSISSNSFNDNWSQRLPRRNSHNTRFLSENQPPKLQNGGTTSTNGFTFPILKVNQVSSSSFPAAAPIRKLPVLKEGIILQSSSSSTMAGAPLKSLPEDPPRDSFETHHFIRDHCSSRQAFTFPSSPKSRNIKNNNIDDDAASDASSELFEIESFSTQTTTTTTTKAAAVNPSIFLYQRKDSLDEAPSCQTVRSFRPNSYDRKTSLDEPAEYCYEPSEASIDWSVTTAEGLDRASVANASEADYNDIAVPEMLVEKSRRRSSMGNGLLSCRSEKAVSVGPRPLKVGPTYDGHKVGQSTLGMWGVGHQL